MEFSFMAEASGMVFLAAVAQSLTGFGFALVLVPLLSVVWDPKSVVVVSTVLNGLLSVSMTFRLRRQLVPSKIGLLLAGALAGIPVGMVILFALSPAPLRVLIGAAVIVLGLLIYLGLRFPVRAQRWPFVAAGILSGLLQSSTSMGGPPAILYLMSQGYSRAFMRGTLLAFFGPLSLLTAAGFAIGGLIGPGTLLVCAALVPATLLGIYVGETIFPRVSSELFRGLVVLLIVVAGTLSVVTGLRGL